MATQVQFRGGTTAEHSTFTGASREVTVDTDKETLVVHDGSTAGGFPVLRQDGSNSAFALGSAASPSLKWDANTGIYSPGADQIAISTGGAGRLFVDASGRLLLGISTNPTGIASDFYINNASGGTITLIRNTTPTVAGNLLGFIQFADQAGEIGARIQASAAEAWATGSSSAANLIFNTTPTGSNTPTERLRITSAGLVGIGTTSPDTRLNVVQSSTGRAWSATTGQGDLIVERNGNAGLAIVAANTSASSLNFGDTDDENAGFITYYHNDDALAFRTGGTGEDVRIDSSGRLLVGTSSALGDNRIQVQGDANSSGIFLRRDLPISTIGANVGLYLATINFGNQDGAVGASIRGETDATWSSNDYPSRLVFSTTADGASSPTERMRINSAGLSGFYSSDGNTLYASSSKASGTVDNLFVGTYGATGIYGGTASIIVRTNGNVLNTNNSYTGISDIKLKENVIDARSQWSDIKALQVRKYNFKAETGYNTHTQIGLVAQEVELVSPGLVSESPDRDAEGNDLGTVTKSVNYSVLYMKAIKALQEAMERIETLEAKVAALENT